MVSPNSSRDRLSLAQLPDLTYVVGDVHGHVSLYDKLEEKIRADAEQVLPGRPFLVVLVGDVIDRGVGSAAMLDRLVERQQNGLQRLCLLGNHETMFLDFLKRPDAKSPWLSYGGTATLASYGLTLHESGIFDLPGNRLKQLLDSSIPESHIKLLKEMPVSLRVPGFLICHAGVEPTRPLAEQTDDDLIWGDPSALDSAPYTAPAVANLNASGLKVIHGHVPQDSASETNRRIALDTGAYATGILSAVRLAPNRSPAFITAQTGVAPNVASVHLAISRF